MARGRGRGRPPLTTRKRGRPPKNQLREKEHDSKLQGSIKKLSSERKKLSSEIIQQKAKLSNWPVSIDKEFCPAFWDPLAHVHTSYENYDSEREATNANLTQIVNTNMKKKNENIDKDSLETNSQALSLENVYYSNRNTDGMKTMPHQVVSNCIKHEIESSDMNLTGQTNQSKKLAPLKIHKNRFIPSCDEEDDDKTPEYPLSEDSSFFFNTHKLENDSDKSRNVFSAMYSAMSYNEIDSHNTNTSSLNSTEKQIDNDINVQESRKLSSNGTKPKVQRIQIIPKMSVPTTQSSGCLANDIVGSRDTMAEDSIEDKQGDNIPRLSPVQETINGNIKLPSQLFNSQPPKLIRICSEKVSPVARYEANNPIEENRNERYRDSVEQYSLKESMYPISSADKLAVTKQTEENKTISDGVLRQVDDTSILSKHIDSQKECVYQSNEIYSPDKTMSYTSSSLTQDSGSVHCSENTPQKQYSCHNEPISDDELSPKPLMIDEHCQLDSNVKPSKGSCSKVLGKPDGRDVNTIHSGHSAEESVPVQVTETQPSTLHHEPVDSVPHWTGQTSPSKPQNSPSLVDNEGRRNYSKGAVNKNSKECSSNQLGSWFTGFDHDNDSFDSSQVHSSDKSISGYTSTQSLYYKDNLAKNTKSEKETKNTEARTVEEGKTGLDVHKSPPKSALIRTNQNISVPDGANGLDCLVNPRSEANCLSDHSLVHLSTPLDSLDSNNAKNVNKRTAQSIADMQNNTCVEPGRQMKTHDKQVPHHPAETGNNLILSNHEAYKSTQDNLLIQTNERSRHTDRNQSNFHGEVPLFITTAKERHDQYSDLSDRRLSSSRLNALPLESLAHYYSRDMSQVNRSNIHTYKPSMISVSEGLSVCKEAQKTSFSTANLKTSSAGYNGLKETRLYSSISPHLNIECVQRNQSPQHTFSQGPKQSFATHSSGYKHYVPPTEASHLNTQSRQFYPITTYGQHSGDMPPPQSSVHFHSYAAAQRNYPAVTLQYLNNEMMHAFPQTVNANMPMHDNNYVHSTSKPWPTLDNSEQQSLVNSHGQREPHVSYKGRKELLNSDTLLPKGPYCFQDGRPDSLYHFRKVPSNCPVSVASVPSLVPASPYPLYQRSSDKSSIARKLLQHQNNLQGHCAAILAAQRGRESVDNSREKEIIYPSWVRVPEAINIDRFAKPINTENPKAKKCNDTVHPFNQLKNLTDIAMEPTTQKKMNTQAMVRKRHHKTSRNNSESGPSIILEEPLDLSINSKSSPEQLRIPSSEYSSDISSRNYPEVGNTRETQKATSSNMELNAHNQGNRLKDVLGSSKISSNKHDKTSEKIGNYFKEASTLSEPNMMGNPSQFVVAADSTDLSETRSSRVDSSSDALFASIINWPSNKSPQPVLAASPDILQSPSNVPRISRCSSRASDESFEATPTKNIRIPLEKFQTSTPDKNSYASMMIAHITSKVKKTKEKTTVTDELLGFFKSQDDIQLSNTLNYNIIDLTDGDDVVSISSGDSDDEDRGIEHLKSSGSTHSLTKQSGPSQSTYSHTDNDVIVSQDNLQISGQASNTSGFNSLKVNKAVKESMAQKVKEAVSLHSMSNELAAQTAAVSASNVSFPISGANKSKETPEPSAEQAAATLLMLSANPLYNNLMIVPETSESYQEKVYQIQPLLGENETNSSQEKLTSKSQSFTVRSGTKTGRRVGRPPKDDVWPQKNIEPVPVQQGAINTITNTFAGNFDTSLVQSTLTSLTMSQINNGNVDNANSFPKPLTVQQMSPTPPFIENVHRFPSATVKRIDPKVAQLINFRLNRKNKEVLESANKQVQNEADPELLPNIMCNTIVQPSTSTTLTSNLQDGTGIVKKKRKRRTKKEMMEAALLQSQNPNKKTRNKYRPRQKKKAVAVKQTAENAYENGSVPFEKQILSSGPTESRPMVNELALTGCISPPATPDQSRKQAAPLGNHYHFIKEQEKRLFIDVQEATRQTNNEEFMNIEHFVHQHVVTQAHNEDGLVVISLQPAQVDTPDKTLPLPRTMDSRHDICTKDLLSQHSLQGSGVCVDNLWLMPDKNAQRIDRTEEEEVIDWLSRNSRKK